MLIFALDLRENLGGFILFEQTNIYTILFILYGIFFCISLYFFIGFKQWLHFHQNTAPRDFLQVGGTQSVRVMQIRKQGSCVHPVPNQSLADGERNVKRLMLHCQTVPHLPYIWKKAILRGHCYDPIYKCTLFCLRNLFVIGSLLGHPPVAT